MPLSQEALNWILLPGFIFPSTVAPSETASSAIFLKTTGNSANPLSESNFAFSTLQASVSSFEPFNSTLTQPIKAK